MRKDFIACANAITSGLVLRSEATSQSSICSWKSCHFKNPLLLCEVATSLRSTSQKKVTFLFPRYGVPKFCRFQRAEFLVEHGFVDMIVHRKDLRSEIARLIDYCGK